MQYLLDTVAIIRHFSDKGRIGYTATNILDHIEKNDDFLVISVISLMEIMYLFEKNRITIDLESTLERIQASSKYGIINLSPEILSVSKTIEFYELHDRLILGTAKWLDIPILSSDHKFSEVTGIEVIWN
jgi:PIN domain nuclease of toxin-antitoxin system